VPNKITHGVALIHELHQLCDDGSWLVGVVRWPQPLMAGVPTMAAGHQLSGGRLAGFRQPQTLPEHAKLVSMFG